MQKNAIKESQKTKRDLQKTKRDLQKTKGKMADINPTVSILLNVSGLNSKIKRQTL